MRVRVLIFGPEAAAIGRDSVSVNLPAGAERPSLLTPEQILARLNPPQAEAVSHLHGPLLILAGAGSGKTRVLAHRVAYLVASGVKQE